MNELQFYKSKSNYILSIRICSREKKKKRLLTSLFSFFRQLKKLLNHNVKEPHRFPQMRYQFLLVRSRENERWSVVEH